MDRIFAQKASYDLRNLLGGAEKFLDQLVPMMHQVSALAAGFVDVYVCVSVCWCLKEESKGSGCLLPGLRVISRHCVLSGQDYSFPLHSIRCLPLKSDVRVAVGAALQKSFVPNVVYSILIHEWVPEGVVASE